MIQFPSVFSSFCHSILIHISCAGGAADELNSSLKAKLRPCIITGEGEVVTNCGWIMHTRPVDAVFKHHVA